jgi:ABC-type polysaccharide/polyol phosphate export permease
MTISRILIAPVNSSHILTAKFLYSSFAILVVQVVLWVIAIPVFNIHVFDFVQFFKGVLLMVITGTIFLAFVYSLPFKATIIESISSVIIILVCLFGGIFITPHTLPGNIAGIINLSPFYFPVKLINSAFGVTEKGILFNNQLLFVSGLAVICLITFKMFKNKINKLVKG